jgi:hypothetical protein
MVVDGGLETTEVEVMVVDGGLETTEVEVMVVDGGLETTEEIKESIFKTHFPGTFIFDKEERLEMFVDKTSGNL